MSVAGVLGLFRANPHQPIGADGRMALADHLRELRARLLRVVLVLLIAVIVALFFYNQLLAVVFDPYQAAVSKLPHDTNTIATINGVGGPLLLQLKLSGLAAIVATSPYWLYQIWAFIVPGLHPHEKRWTRLFVAVAGPLFVVGVAVGYYVLPKGLEVLISFTPADLTNLVEFGEYFSFMTRMLLVFGVAFEIPLFVVLLNLAGIVSAAHWPTTDRGSWWAPSCSPPWRPRPRTRSPCSCWPSPCACCSWSRRSSRARWTSGATGRRTAPTPTTRPR